MNAERLHAIAKAVKADFRSTKAISLLQQLHTALQSQVNQPAAPQFQQQVSQFRQQIDEALMGAPSNGFSPTWRQTLDQLGVSPLLGNGLRVRIEEIFARNQITPATANEEIQKIFEAVQRVSQAIDQLLQGLASLNVGAEELEPGACELGVLVPRAAVENQLPQLGQELEKLQKMFAPLAELATGARPDFTVRTISSSDFSVFVEVAPKVAACIAVAVERVVSLYKQLLEIRRLRQELREQGLSDESLGGVDSHANDHMGRGIGTLIDELVERFGKERDKGRRNELRTELRRALNQIANRIDHGYNIDLRAEPPEEDAADSAERRDAQEQIESIAAVAPRLQFINLTGRPILSLPEGDRESGDSKRGG